MSSEGPHTFDSFEGAIHAPSCEYCGIKVIGHGLDAASFCFC